VPATQDGILHGQHGLQASLRGDLQQKSDLLLVGGSQATIERVDG
jgi:hypothetical protein